MRGAWRAFVCVGTHFLGALLAAAPGGCGAPTPPPPTTARGSVHFQGRPLAGGLVVFAPDAERGQAGKPATAVVGPDGVFQLEVGGGPNIPAGWYRVAFADAAAEPAAGFPAALRRPDRSGVVREVRAGKDNVFRFTIELPPS